MERGNKVVYFPEFGVTTELAQLAEASVVYQVHNALYHSKLAHNSLKAQLSITWLTTLRLLQNPSICFGGGFFLRNGTLNDGLLADLFVSQGHELHGCKRGQSLALND